MSNPHGNNRSSGVKVKTTIAMQLRRKSAFIFRSRTVALGAIASVIANALWIAPAGWAQAYRQTNLVSDLPGLAAQTDPNLVNPWGIAASATLLFWVADNHSGVASLYDGSGTPQALVVNIPAAQRGTIGSPTGVVRNGTNDFRLPGDVVGTTAPAPFIFATEDGTISGYAGPPDPTTLVAFDNSAAGAVYKGLTIGSNGSANFLYATNFHVGTIDVLDAAYAPAVLADNFSDPTIPAGYAPFNIRNLGGVLYVTYALQDENAQDDVPGPGNGFINKFDFDGHLLGRFASRGVLNSPWGLALAPAGFGPFAGALLVGNFGDGRINAFDPATGVFLGSLGDNAGVPLTNQGLWGLEFGQGGESGDPNTLYFAAGIPGPDAVEDHGLFGSIAFLPAERQLINISTRALVGTGENVVISGFIIRAEPGSAALPKRLLLRGIGPSLKVGNTPIPGRLLDSVLELHDASGQTIAVNDNWQDTDRSAIQATGLAPADDSESALVIALNPDANYTAILRGKDGTTGIGLIESYDLEPATPTHLANLSARASVSAGDNVLIGGLIISGGVAEQILLRAIGPSLAAQGISASLQNPTLDLYDGQGNLLAHNDNWMEEPDGRLNPARADMITATGLPPANPAESAVLTAPAPGNYTVIVRGKNNTAGVALVEAFRLGPPATLPAASAWRGRSGGN